MQHTLLIALLAVVASIIVHRECWGFAPATVIPINQSAFSGAEALVAFSDPTPLLDSFTADGVKFTNLSGRGWILVQVGGLDPLFDNIPGASLGSFDKTTAAATVPTQLLIELPSPARRFGMLLSSGSVSTWSLTAFSNDVGELGSISATMPGSTEAVFAGLASTAPFDRIHVMEIDLNGQNDSFDDIRFELIPEPLSWLLTMPLLALLLRRRALDNYSQCH